MVDNHKLQENTLIEALGNCAFTSTVLLLQFLSNKSDITNKGLPNAIWTNLRVGETAKSSTGSLRL